MLEKAVDYLERLGDNVVDNVEGFSDSGPVDGKVCEHGTHSYLVLYAEGWEWVQLQYPFSVDQIYAAKRLAEEGSDEITEAQIQQAREELDRRLNQMPVNERRKLRLNLIEMLSAGGLIAELDTTNQVNIHGFNVETKSFVGHNDYSIGDFHADLQHVIGNGWIGREFLVHNFGFAPDPNSEPSTGGNSGSTDHRL